MSQTLITGYGPFAGVTENPSAWLAENSGRNYQVLKVSYSAVDAWIDSIDPGSFDRLLMIGVNAKATKLNLERVGRNKIGEVSDVDGVLPSVTQIEVVGPMQVASTLWTPSVLKWASKESLVTTSEDAGSYLCNYILYRTLRKFTEKQVGFLHVPHPESIALSTQIEILKDLITVIEES